MVTKTVRVTLETMAIKKQVKMTSAKTKISSLTLETGILCEWRPNFLSILDWKRGKLIATSSQQCILRARHKSVTSPYNVKHLSLTMPNDL